MSNTPTSHTGDMITNDASAGSVCGPTQLSLFDPAGGDSDESLLLGCESVHPLTWLPPSRLPHTAPFG